MPRIASAYRGPAVVMGIGVGFALVGTVPVAITLGLGMRTSATVIGVGFIGFGVMLILPGFCWCLAMQKRRLGLLCGRRHATEDDPLESTQAISKTPSTIKDDGTLDSLMTPVHDSEAAVATYGGTDVNAHSELYKNDKEDLPR